MELKCEFSTSLFFNIYTCKITEATIHKQPTFVKSITGKHLEGKSNLDVQRVEFLNLADVHYFPRGLAEIFPNLKQVTFYCCPLKEISANDLLGLENITSLNIYRSELTKLPKNLLLKMKILESVRFRCNDKLVHVSSKMFDVPCRKVLSMIIFQGNVEINEYVEVGDQGEDLQTIIDSIKEKCLEPNEEFEIPYHLSIAGKIGQLWQSGRFSDFIIECQSKEFRVHKTILGAQSSVFAAMFEIEMQEKLTGRMKIDDVSEETVEDFLRFLYLNEIRTESNYMDLYTLASLYDVSALKLATEHKILEGLVSSNALEILEFGQLHDLKVMTKAALIEIGNMFPQFNFTDDLLKPRGQLRKLLDAKQKIDEANEEFNVVAKQLNLM